MTNLHITVATAAEQANIWKDYVLPVGTTLLAVACGYIPASHLARRGTKELLARDEKARRDSEARAARLGFVKLTILVNTILTYHQQVEQMIAKADTDGNGDMGIADRLSIFPGLDRDPAITFAADELEVFIAAKRADYVDDLVLLSRRYSAVLTNLDQFGRLKTELHYEAAKRGVTSRDINLVSTTRLHLTPSDANYFRVKIDELEQFARPMRKLLTETADFATKVAEQYEPITKAYLGADATIGFSLPDREAANP